MRLLDISAISRSFLNNTYRLIIRVFFGFDLLEVTGSRWLISNMLFLSLVFRRRRQARDMNPLTR